MLERSVRQQQFVGVALFSGFVVGIALLAWRFPAMRHLALLLLACSIPAFASGVIEDLTKRVSPLRRMLATLLAAVSTYMLITGIVYNALLRNIPLPQGSTVPWSNEILHVWAPIFLLLDVLFAPRRRALSWSALGAVVVFPIVWLAYTLIRGPLVHDFRTGNDWWYPYPFLNPNVQPWGYVGVALYSIGIAVAIVAVGAFTVWVGRRRGSATSPRR